MRFVLFLVMLALILQFTSCKNEKNNQASILNNLTSDSVKYWDVVFEEKLFDKNNSKIFPYYTYSFNTNGTFLFFHRRGNKRVRLIGSDVVKPNSWKQINDSLIEMNDYLFKIISLSEDTFKYYDTENKTIIILSKNHNQKSDINLVEEAPSMLIQRQ
jgi:hypothetical protein